MKVVILVGSSGAGKSTWTRQFVQEQGTDYTVVSADHYFEQPDGTYQFDQTKLPQAHGSCQRNYREALDRKCPLVIVDNTSTRAWERKEYIALAKQYGYEVWLKVFKVDPEVAAKRTIHEVPLSSIKKMIDRIDVPEGFYEV